MKYVTSQISSISLERYKFINKNYDLKESIKTSLSILDLAKKEITIPILAITYLSPLRSLFLEENVPLGFVTWLVGESGSQKSSLSALAVSHFGDFERDTLPGGFKDTINSIEKKAFTLKDTLFAIDDYYPSPILQEGKKMDAVAESLFGLVVLWRKLRREEYKRTIQGLYHAMQRLGIYSKAPSKKKKISQ